MAVEQLTKVRLPDFDALPDKGKAWFAAANAIDRVLEPPITAEPWDYQLTVPLEQRKMPDGTVIIEQLPTSLHIRPRVAADLCAGDRHDGAEAQQNAIYAKIHGVDLDMLEWRLDAADVQAASLAVDAAGGEEAAGILARAFDAAGGVVLDVDGNEVPDPGLAWWTATQEALTTDQGEYCLLQCRTPGIGTVKIGPIRSGHLRIYDDAAAQHGPWRGRLDALAVITGKTAAEIDNLRPEDALRAWGVVERLKKKLEVRALSNFAAARSTQSTAGAEKTSTG